jgi:hypothetical protein
MTTNSPTTLDWLLDRKLTTCNTHEGYVTLATCTSVKTAQGREFLTGELLAFRGHSKSMSYKDIHYKRSFIRDDNFLTHCTIPRQGTLKLQSDPDARYLISTTDQVVRIQENTHSYNRSIKAFKELYDNQ